LSDEIPLYGGRHNGAHFSYDPSVDGAVGVRVGSETFQARVGGDVILNGKLKAAVAAGVSPAVEGARLAARN
jgi:hypothetical protein